MNIVVGALITLGVTAFTVTAMLLVRRRAPEGSYFSDGDRASGVFGVLATGFSVLLGFIIFLAFQSYDQARSGAETEAVTVAQQVQTAQFLPADVREELTGQLVCYARAVVGRRVAADAGRARWATRSTRGVRALFATIDRSSRRPTSSSPRTTGGWTRRRPASRPASTGCTAPRA